MAVERGEKIKTFKGMQLGNSITLACGGISHSGTLTLCASQMGCVLENSFPLPSQSTCIAGLVGVKIDRLSLNWKWSLSALCSC